MATGDRFDRTFSNLTIFAASLAVAVAVPVLTYQPTADAGGIAGGGAQTPEAARLSPRCQEADRAGVAELASVLQRNRPGDAPNIGLSGYVAQMAEGQRYRSNERQIDRRSCEPRPGRQVARTLGASIPGQRAARLRVTQATCQVIDRFQSQI